MQHTLSHRRGIALEVGSETAATARPEAGERPGACGSAPMGDAAEDGAVAALERFDRVYRALCAAMYNYAPTSGHPGGSISSGRAAAAIIFSTLEYDVSDPDRHEADIVTYAAGHKALGLYALWALRDEVLRLHAPDLLPQSAAHRLRLEDLLGFRRNPVSKSPLFLKHKAKALDGHPTPATPFLRVATGASGVGVCSAVGLALAARDYYGKDGPRVHVIEGEGGMTPGRVAEAFAAAGTMGLSNLTVHVDWNQSSIDSDAVCRDGDKPGDYVQWDPAEFALFHDWNVVRVADGHDVSQVLEAQRKASELDDGQPTAIVYRTVKGWKYGIQGKASHGSGHKFCSQGFIDAVAEAAEDAGLNFPGCTPGEQRCKAGSNPEEMEVCYFEALVVIRAALERSGGAISALAEMLRDSRRRLDARSRAPRPRAPQIQKTFALAGAGLERSPALSRLVPGEKITLREALALSLEVLGAEGSGSVLVAAADLLDSTAIRAAAKSFPAGYFHAGKNPESRVLSTGGICEDAMTGILTGIAAFGRHIGVGSSYGAFIAPLGHIASRLHAIGGQARREIRPQEPYKPIVLVCGHAGLKTGEDGPTHADPQALQVLQDNFPKGTMITLTPWEPAEIPHLLSEALTRRPAVIAPYVTRPTETIPDRAALGLAPAEAARQGVYRLYPARPSAADVTVVLQGSDAGYAFVTGSLPVLREKGVRVEAFYVASAELFDALSAEEQDAAFPAAARARALGITGFTLATMYRWVTSERGRRHTLHPFRHGHYLGSGPAHLVIAQAGIDGLGQVEAILGYLAEE